MEYRKFDNTIVVRLEKDEEILTSLTKLCEAEKIRLASVSGLGAVNDITLGILNTKTKDYSSKQYQGDYEILTLNGNITEKDGAPYLHMHLGIGNVTTDEFHGGHMNNAIVSATAEIVVTVINGTVDREFSEEIGLNLIKF